MYILWKVIAVIMITMGGAGITCGGNLLLNAGRIFTEDFLFILWNIEWVSIFLLSIWFFWKYTIRIEKKVKKDTL